MTIKPGQLQAVTDGTHTAAYDFVANWPVGGNVAFRNHSSFQMSATKGYDLLNLLPNIVSTADGGKLVTTTANTHTAGPSQTWGLDLSGNLQGAGGVGGLLARTDSSGSLFYHSDGAGNVTILLDADRNMAARYLYDPYGNLVAQWGPKADANHYRFSSKEIHPNSGLYDFGFRSYDPSLQRWLNRDPSGEQGGINLYRFARNNSLSFGDPDGRGLLSWIFGEGWSGPGADAFEESIGESMMEQGAEMKAGLDVLRDDGLWQSRNYLVDDMSDRYADMMLNYGEGTTYLIAANDLTGGTPLMEGIYGVDLQSQCELNKQDRWQRGLMGGGQMGLSVLGGARMVSSARAGYTGIGLPRLSLGNPGSSSVPKPPGWTPDWEWNASSRVQNAAWRWLTRTVENGDGTHPILGTPKATGITIQIHHGTAVG